MKTAIFGREDGELYELLGLIQDIASDGHGSIFVLDAASRVKTVHVIDTEAQYLGRFGSAGEGPGEFMHPSHILVDDGGDRILIAGRAEREVDVFEWLDSDCPKKAYWEQYAGRLGVGGKPVVAVRGVRKVCSPRI